MKCSRCSKTAVISVREPLCAVHFCSEFEKRATATIVKYKLLKKSDRVAVACSGGKDSTALLYLLKKKGYSVTAVCIDEGISSYREVKLAFLEDFCQRNKIKLVAGSFKKRFGKGLDELVKHSKKSPCAVCGSLRRKLLNELAQPFDVVATGHNMDDEAQAVMMNLMRANTKLLERCGPRSGISPVNGLVPRVKPFYMCSEKETMVYAILNNINVPYGECPYVKYAYRAKIRDVLNELGMEAKAALIGNFLKMKGKCPRK